MAKKGFLDGYDTYDPSNGFGNSRKWREAFNQRMSKEEAKEILNKTTETPYSILGIPENATQKEITKAFRNKIMEWHPDRNQHRIAEAEEMSKKIIAAYVDLTS